MLVTSRCFKLTCRAVGVHPPLELSHYQIKFAATALYDMSVATLYVINSHLSMNSLTHSVPRIGSEDTCPVGPTSFEFLLPPDSPITISPSVGTVLPGKVGLGPTGGLWGAGRHSLALPALDCSRCGGSTVSLRRPRQARGPLWPVSVAWGRGRPQRQRRRRRRAGRGRSSLREGLQPSELAAGGHRGLAARSAGRLSTGSVPIAPHSAFPNKAEGALGRPPRLSGPL